MPTLPSQAAARAYLGIDPGKSGSMVLLNAAGKRVNAANLSLSETDIWNWIADRTCTNQVFAGIEKVGGFIAGGGKNMASGHTMFEFGGSYYGLRMALIGNKIPFDTVLPATWQKGLSIPPRKRNEGKTQWKNRLKAVAQRLFPSESITLALADAYLIAEYVRRKMEGQLR